MGVVYHTHYLDYFEEARTEALRELGVVYKTLESEGIQMPVIDLGVKFLLPAFYDDLLAIETRVVEPPRTRLRCDYAVRRAGDDPVLATGHVTLCFIDTGRNRPVMAPEAVRSLFLVP
jgi:acyl-CoA thioester hydrolase